MISQLVRLFIFSQLFVSIQCVAKPCCLRTKVHNTLIRYIQAIRNRSNDNLSETLLDNFELTKCDGSLQTRQQMNDEIQKINVPIDTRSFVILDGYEIVDDVLKFSANVTNRSTTVSTNHYEAKQVNGEWRLFSEKMEDCIETSSITTTLIDENDVGDRLARQILDSYLYSIRTQNKTRLSGIVSKDFKLLSCDNKNVNSTELLKPENSMKAQKISFQSGIFSSFLGEHFNFHLGDDEENYSVFHTVLNRKTGKYEIKQHLLFDCIMKKTTGGTQSTIDIDAYFSRKIAHYLFDKYCISIILTSYRRFSKVVSSSFEVTNVDGETKVLERYPYFHRTISYAFYEPNENRKIFRIEKMTSDGSFVFEANINEWNRIEFQVREINGTFMIVAERHINNYFKNHNVNIKSLGSIYKSQTVEHAENLLDELQNVLRENNWEQLSNLTTDNFKVTDSNGKTLNVVKNMTDILNYWDQSLLDYQVIHVVNDGLNLLEFYAQNRDSVKWYTVKKIDGKLYLTSETTLSEDQKETLFYNILPNIDVSNL